MGISFRPIEDVKPYENNPRDITEASVEALANSIRQFGFRQPIVWIPTASSWPATPDTAPP